MNTLIRNLSILAVSMGLAVNAGASGELEAMGLQEVKKVKLDTLYLDKSHDYGRYGSVYIADIGLDDVHVELPRSSKAHRNDFEFDEARAEGLQEDYREIFEREFAKRSDLEMVSEPRDDTLILATRLHAIAPAAGYDVNNYAGRARTYSDTSGSAVLEVFLLDASTGELVALGVDKKSVGHTWINNNSVTNNANVRHTLNSWARQFAKASSELPERAAKAKVK